MPQPMESHGNTIEENETPTSTVANDINATCSQRRKASPALEYFLKINDEEYLCKICKADTPSKEVKVKRDKTSSTIKLWNHLEKFHIGTFKKLRPSSASATMTDYFKKASKIPERTKEQIKKECIDLIVKTDAPFSLLDHPQFKWFCTVLVQGDPSIPSGLTVRRNMETVYEDERDKIRKLLRPIERLSLTVDTWTTPNNISILGITMHWIDDTWTLCEQVLGVEELRKSHQGAFLAEELYRVLEDFGLTQKVFAITTDNASNNKTMVETLEGMLNDSGSMFTKQYHVPCIAHVLNLAVQGGLRELGNSSSTLVCYDSEDDETVKDAREAFPHKEFGVILHRLRKLVIAANCNPQKVRQYKELCQKHKMPNTNLLITDVPTRWNSTYDMIIAAWEKRKVLNTMAASSAKDGKSNLSITSNEWDLLKMFADELLAFREATEVVSKSKAITSPNVTSVFELLLKQLNSSIDDLDKPCEDALMTPSRIGQMKTLKRAYNVMKGKLLKYEPQVKEKPIFPIATMLDPTLKLEYIPSDDQEYILTTLETLLQAMPTPSTSNTRSHSEAITNNSASCSKMMTELIKRKRKRNTSSERPISAEIFSYLQNSQVEESHLGALQWWRKIGSEKYPRLAVLARGFLSVCASSTPSERLFSSGRGVVTFKRGRLTPKSISILMTLKSWGYEDISEIDVEELAENVD